MHQQQSWCRSRHIGSHGTWRPAWKEKRQGWTRSLQRLLSSGMGFDPSLTEIGLLTNVLTSTRSLSLDLTMSRNELTREVLCMDYSP